MSVKVSILSGCNGMGSCVRLAPSVFAMDPITGKAVVLKGDCSEHREAVMQAGRSCPFVAVEVDGVSLQEKIDTATVESCQRLTPDIVELKLHRPGFTFIPGQYVFLRLRDSQGEFFRTYSVVESHKSRVSLLIRLVGHGRAGQVLNSIVPGTRVGLTKAKGLFTLRTMMQPKLFITGGTGLAPVIPMCAAAPDARKLVIIGARSEGDLIWVERLLAMPNTEVISVLQKPGPLWTGPVGLVTAPLYDLDLTQWVEFYTCGSPGMVEAVTRTLIDEGVAEDRIFADSFVPSGSGTVPAPSSEMIATLKSPGRDWPGLMRRWHYLASAPLALIFLFYALTGFIANRSDFFVGQDTAISVKKLPEGTVFERDRLIPVLAAMLPDEAKQATFEPGPPIVAIFEQGTDRSWKVKVDPESRKVSITEQGNIPTAIGLTKADVAAYLTTQISGIPDLERATEEDGTIEMELASVWGTHQAKIDLASHTWTATSITPPLIVSLVDLHRGKHAGFWQRIVVDVSALGLSLVTLSGITMSMIAASAQRRRQALYLFSASAIVLTLLLVAR